MEIDNLRQFTEYHREFIDDTLEAIFERTNKPEQAGMVLSLLLAYGVGLISMRTDGTLTLSLKLHRTIEAFAAIQVTNMMVAELEEQGRS